jgi:hypothetical protein
MQWRFSFSLINGKFLASLYKYILYAVILCASLCKSSWYIWLLQNHCNRNKVGNMALLVPVDAVKRRWNHLFQVWCLQVGNSSKNGRKMGTW